MGSTNAEVNPRATRQARRCRIVTSIGKTEIEGIVDTGASGGNCIDYTVFSALPREKYHILSVTPNVCVGINKIPVRIIAKALIEFSIKNENNPNQPDIKFREEFNIIQNLVHPLVVGLPFLQKHKAILSFENNEIYIGNFSFPLGQPPRMVEVAPPHMAAFENVTIQPHSKMLINTYLTGNQGLFDKERAEALYVRPFHTECNRDVPHMTPHTIINPKENISVLEVMNVWDFPINISVDTPIALVEAVNPTIQIDEDANATGGGNAATVDAAGDVINPSKEPPPPTDAPPDVPPSTDEPRPHTNDPPSTPAAAAFSLSFNAASPAAPEAPPTTPDSEEAEIKRGFDEIMVEVVEEDDDEEAQPCNNFDESYSGDAVMEEIGSRDPIEKEQQSCVSSGKDQTPISKSINTSTSQNDLTEKRQQSCASTEKDQTNEDARELKMNMEGCLFEGEMRDRFDALCEKYDKIFSKTEKDLGTTTMLYHEIELTTTNPIHARNHRIPPPEIQKDIHEETNKLLESGCIQESTSPYSAPIVLVRKKNGGWRYCTDFRRLNKATVKQNYPLPNIHDGVRRLKNPKVFSTLDLTKGYHQIAILESQRHLFAFNDGTRQLEYVKVPMGAKNSSASMQQLMEMVMRGLPLESMMVYLDDILLATEDLETHLQLLEKIFEALARANLKINPAKCFFANRSVSALGFQLDENGIRPDEHNLKKVREWPQPQDITGVRSFVGLANYYRCHIAGFAKRAEPLTDMLKKNSDFEWTEACEKSFQDLKTELLEGSATSYPDFEKRFFVKPDASKTCVGAVLTQKDERGKESMIAAASQKLSPAESAWAPYDREMFAIVWAIRSFAHYLRFRPFTVYTDHRPLLSCIGVDPKKDASGKRTRWALELQTYEFEIKHKSGKQHGDADALSRAEHADEPSSDPRDDDDLVILGAMVQGEVDTAELTADETNRERVAKAQRNDPEICKFYDALKNGGLTREAVKKNKVGRWFVRNNNKLRVKKGLLYHRKQEGDETIGRLVIPQSMVEEVMARAHGDYRTGHPGAKRLQARLERFCIWPTIAKDVDRKVKECHECQLYRPKNKKEVPIIPQHAQYPLHVVVTDLLALKPPSDGFDHVLVVEDRFTHYCALYPMRGAEAATMAKNFEKFICRFGFPTIWASDNGPEFRNRLVEALEKVYETRHKFSLPYHPMKQGAVERKN